MNPTILQNALTAQVTQIVAGMYGAVAANYNVATTMGEVINTAGAAANPLLDAVPGIYASGTAGWALGQIIHILSQVNLITPSTPITAVSPITTGAVLRFVAGASYLVSDGRGLRIAIPDPAYPTDDCSLAITVKPTPGSPDATVLLTATGTFVEVGSQWYAEFNLSAANTLLAAGETVVSDRLWDLVEILPDGTSAVIYSASPCVVTNLLTRP